MAIYTFECGCSFDVVEKDHAVTSAQTGLPSINFDIYKITYDCTRTWDMICDGRTKGVFQLESNLGKSWAKRIKPRDIGELADLCALIRPGCLKAFVAGKSMTQHYLDRKYGREKTEYLDPCLEPILKPTQGVLVYQEQSMKIAQVVAGFDLQQADDLRKAIGKKKAGLMSQVKKSFIEGASSEGIVTDEVAEEIFGWIEKSNRYAFNKSHAVSYAMCGYWSAYAKAHFTTNFFCSYFYYSSGKQDPQREVRELFSDCKLEDIPVKHPSLSRINSHFTIEDKAIYFGLENLKSIGKNQASKFMNAVDCASEELDKNISEFSWLEFLIYVCPNVSKTVAKTIISCGMLSSISTSSRNSMIYEFDILCKLTKKEKDWLRENFDPAQSLDFKDTLKKLAPTKKLGGGTSNKNRMEIIKSELYQLENPPYDLSDDPEWIINEEDKIFGIPLTYSKVDACDTSSANTTCKEVFNGKTGFVILATAINQANEYRIKKGKSKGKKMCFLHIEDATCELDNVVVFPDCYQEFKELIYNGNTVLLSGKVERGDDSIVVKKVSQI